MKRLVRSRSQRMIAGVCGGIAEYLDIDPTAVRVLYAILSVLSAAFPGIIIYLLLVFIIPLE
ncbi:PspC family transcriptional regulator [Desulforamulus profundi]|uniref:PspC family transcriptional regulator n=1 Tax=Desulforamulus profundi TaxID=1383067 RepID=A0A2C6MH09_9FIRM|nr:PspC domain-containing protein [Desulforamulus profundi]PHJ39538.1 PspC family transcriptional regulator [Desulforamulus profundi]